MGLWDNIIGFFEESPEEIEEEIKENKDRIKEIDRKLRSKKKQGFFSESKEELKEERKDLASVNLELNRALKVAKVKQKKRNPVKINYKFIVGVVVIIVIGYLIYNYVNYYQENNCSELTDYGTASIGCVSTNEPGKTDMHEITFFLKNNLDYKAKCTINSFVKINSVVISEKNFDMGDFEPGEIKKQWISMVLPQGDSNFELSGKCG